MVDLSQKDYIVVVQCQIAKQQCSGYSCEKAFYERIGGFAAYPKENAYRTLYLTCGGCPGLALRRQLSDVANRRKKSEDVGKGQIVVQLSSCITKDNFHGPPCPHLECIKTVIDRVGLDVCQDTFISEVAQRRRQKGKYDAAR